MCNRPRARATPRRGDEGRAAPRGVAPAPGGRGAGAGRAGGGGSTRGALWRLAVSAVDSGARGKNKSKKARQVLPRPGARSARRGAAAERGCTSAAANGSARALSAQRRGPAGPASHERRELEERCPCAREHGWAVSATGSAACAAKMGRSLSTQITHRGARSAEQIRACTQIPGTNLLT